ncbi:acyltransferase family protein [Sphingomonas sp. Leaf242]|uniref:acyltransferase family protein n=1 Tax=Sphingomonas sp. Leaf242 TaxID=1736304 RepID=UPI0009E8215D|nr:acyltransferase family protein [Sphingomonas sp. Leaf242]
MDVQRKDEIRRDAAPHWIGLDHIRALAAFLVFSWHFMHGQTGNPIPFQGVHLLAVIDEGHTGVALFMTLSGYLFAKILDGRRVLYVQFFWTRMLRLGPLLLVVIVIEGVRLWYNGGNIRPYAIEILKGVVWPSLPRAQTHSHPKGDRCCERDS